MSYVKNLVFASLFGIVSACNGYAALNCLFNVENAREIALQRTFSYREAEDFAVELTQGDYIKGFLHAGAAGLSWAMVIHSCGRGREEK